MPDQPPLNGCSSAAAIRQARGAVLALLVMLMAACQPPDAGNGPQPEPPAQSVPRAIGTSASPLSLPDYLSTLSQAAATLGIDLSVLPEAAPPELVVLLLDPDQHRPRLLARKGRKKASALRAIDAMRDEPRLSVLVGSGFVSLVDALQPLGLLQVDGNVRNPVEEHGYTRILGLRDQRFRVLHRRDWSSDLFDAALQAGPGVIEAGQLDISPRELQRTRYFRSFVATCGERVALGASVVPMNLRTLGERFLALDARLGLGCDELVNLAGDRESVLGVRLGRDVLFHGDPRRPQAAFVAFEQVVPTADASSTQRNAATP